MSPNEQNQNLINALKAGGHKVGSAAISEEGMLLVNVDDTFMYRPDAVDLAQGDATVEQIRERNKGKIFPNAPATR